MFKTAQGQTTSVPDIARKIYEIIMSDKTKSYEITVGTDSQNFDRTKMVEVIAIHKKGMGGTYFYNIEFIHLITNLKQKINEETSRSLLVHMIFSMNWKSFSWKEIYCLMILMFLSRFTATLEDPVRQMF